MPDNTQELDEILVKLSTEKQKELVPYIGRTIKLDDEVLKAKQAILDWHNKQTFELLDRLETQALELPLSNGREMNLVDVSAIEAERTRLRGDDE